MKSIFFFPPEWSNSHPYLSIPCIYPYIEKNIELECVDLNLKYQQYKRAENTIKKLYGKIVSNVQGKILLKYELIRDYLCQYSTRYYNTMHNSDEFNNFETYIMNSCYKKQLDLYFSVAYKGQKIINSCKRVEDIIPMVEDHNNNPYFDFYFEYFQSFKWQEYDTVLISLAGTHQIIPALTLCNYIKSRKL